MIENDAENLTFNVQADDENVRLDAFLAIKIEDWSRSRLQKLIDDGEVLVNGKTAKSSYKIQNKDSIEVDLVAPTLENFTPEDIPLDIVFEDDELAVINKKSGMIVHQGAGVSGGTLANAIAFHFKFNIPDSRFQNRVGIVHRLDKETSGLIVVAKNETAHEKLSEQFREREVFKSYLALAHGEMEGERGRIDAPLGRDRRNRLRQAVTENGRAALSLWRVREQLPRFALLEVEIKTGRTHQIRVHLASIKKPIVGDELYNDGRDKTVPNAKIRAEIPNLKRFFLHAEKLSFKHPTTGEKLDFTAPLPSQLENFLQFIRDNQAR